MSNVNGSGFEWRAFLPEPQMIIALSAALVSMCALCVSMYEVSLMREQQKAAVWPYLEVLSSNRDGWELQVSNRGVGPAIIEAVVVTVDGVEVEDWPEVSKLLLGHTTATVTSKFNGRVIPQGDSVRVYRVLEPATGKEFSAKSERIAVAVCYRSIYNDRFTAYYRGPIDIPEDCNCDPKRQLQH